jgi:hypothetical protein
MEYSDETPRVCVVCQWNPMCAQLVAQHMSKLYSLSCLMLSIILGMISATEFVMHSSFVQIFKILLVCYCNSTAGD